MRKVGLVYDPVYLSHDTGTGHPERPERLSSVMDRLREGVLWSRFERIQPAEADPERVKRVHAPSYVETIRERIVRGEEILDFGDTHVCTSSWNAALLAAGGVLRAIDTLMDESSAVRAAFCAVRPPGHHAESNRVMGFCLLNNVAVGARYAQEKYGLERIAILDWDVHHGNGTQEIFYSDPTVLYVSLHQYPFYPGTGARSERGEGAGEGYTVNCPMHSGSGEAEYLEAFDREILPALEHFMPELLLISAGFDAHRDDPLAGICLTEVSYGKMTDLAGEIAQRHCNGKIVSVLEGGYDLGALSRSVEMHCAHLLEIAP